VANKREEGPKASRPESRLVRSKSRSFGVMGRPAPEVIGRRRAWAGGGGEEGPAQRRKTRRIQTGDTIRNKSSMQSGPVANQESPMEHPSEVTWKGLAL